jgi:hypothetical protein
VHLTHPLGIKGFENRRVKNDLTDATMLAELLRRVGCRSRGSSPARCGTCGNYRFRLPQSAAALL